MKRITLFTLSSLFLLFSSCRKDEVDSRTGIIGKWKLIEQLADPGDGSGTFEPVTSNKVVEFKSDGTFEGNGDMCLMTSETGQTHNGTYDTASKTFLPDNCMSVAPMSFQYEVSGNTLILSYPCICGCQQKYERL